MTQQDLLVTPVSDAAALLGTVAVIRALNYVGQECWWMSVADPYDPRLVQRLQQARQWEGATPPSFRVHVFAWESPADNDARRVFFDSFSGADQLATIIASESEQMRWREWIGDDQLAERGVRLCSSIVQTFDNAGQVNVLAQLLLQIADDTRQGLFPGGTTQMAYETARLASHEASNQFVRRALAGGLPTRRSSFGHNGGE